MHTERYNESSTFQTKTLPKLKHAKRLSLAKVEFLETVSTPIVGEETASPKHDSRLATKSQCFVQQLRMGSHCHVAPLIVRLAHSFPRHRIDSFLRC